MAAGERSAAGGIILFVSDGGVRSSVRTHRSGLEGQCTVLEPLSEAGEYWDWVGGEDACLEGLRAGPALVCGCGTSGTLSAEVGELTAGDQCAVVSEDS